MTDFNRSNSRSGRALKKGIDSDIARRGRNDTRLQIRKNKREEGLQKRRAMANPVAPQSGNLADPQQQQHQISSGDVASRKFTAADIPTLCELLRKSSPTSEDILHAITGFRKMLSIEHNPPVRDVINAEVLPIFVQLLTYNNEKVQFEAAWALTNVASTEYTRVVVDNGAVPLLVQALMSGSPDVREQCAWCLGNIAGDAPDLRDFVLKHGAMEKLLFNISNPANKSLLNNAVWALSNFCRGKPQPTLDQISAAIPALAQIVMNDSVQADAVSDAGWALSYISDGDDDRIAAVMRTGVTPRLVALLQKTNPAVITPALRTLGNFVSGMDTHTQAVIDANVLPSAEHLLTHPKRNIRKEACWLLSNIAAGNISQITTLMSQPSIVAAVINLATSAEWEVRKEATWTISNICTGGTEIHIHQLVEYGAIDALCSVIDVADPKIMIVVLDALESILKAGEQASRDYIGFVDECDGLDKIEKLQEHENVDVYQKSVDIIEKYFGVEEGEDENLVPENNGEAFSFGLAVDKESSSTDQSTSQQQPLQPFNFSF